MNNTEILYDHYKESVNEIKKQENKRNKLFILVLIHIFILFLISYRPESMCKVFSDLLMDQWKIGFYFSINTIQIILMVSMLYCVVRYYQINVYIDKNYPYIHRLEKELSQDIGKCFGKEGQNYLNDYPKTQNIVYYSYKYIFPILFILALIYRVIFNNTWDSPIIKTMEIVITSILIILNIVYTIDMYKNEKK